MKNYLITRKPDGTLQLLAQALVKGKLIEQTSKGYDSGNASKETKALALAIAVHYFGASPTDLPATAEAERRAEPLMHAFLTHHKLPVGGTLEISSDVIDHFFSLP